jgi:large subunit ribosomal protein L32
MMAQDFKPVEGTCLKENNNRLMIFRSDVMPVPKRKRSRARRDQRFANKGIKAKGLNTCSSCEATISSHQICQNCGCYKGRKVMTTKADRAIKRGVASEAKQAAVQARAPKEEPLEVKAVEEAPKKVAKKK